MKLTWNSPRCTLGQIFALNNVNVGVLFAPQQTNSKKNLCRQACMYGNVYFTVYFMFAGCSCLLWQRREGLLPLWFMRVAGMQSCKGNGLISVYYTHS